MAKKRKAARRKKSFLASRTFLVASVVVLGVIIAAASFFAFTGDEKPKRPVRTKPVVTTEMQVDVIVDNLDYTPRDLTVPKGATVTWKFQDDLPHNVTEDRGAFESDTLQKGDEWSRVFDTPGTFYYYCTLHHIMLGTLVVAE
ncbi:MAG: cupredoxin domain-containing protein [Chloroflexi bacterium]|nr:cupredoxin domain-containing protein [Chloroflexota bacterium]